MCVEGREDRRYVSFNVLFSIRRRSGKETDSISRQDTSEASYVNKRGRRHDTFREYLREAFLTEVFRMKFWKTRRCGISAKSGQE